MSNELTPIDNKYTGNINSIIVNALKSVQEEMRLHVIATKQEIEYIEDKYKKHVKKLEDALQSKSYPGGITNITKNYIELTPFCITFGEKEVCHPGGKINISPAKGTRKFIQMNNRGEIYATLKGYERGTHKIGILSENNSGEYLFMQNMGVYSTGTDKPNIVKRQALSSDYSSYLFTYEDGKKLVLKKKDESGEFEVIDNGFIVSNLHIDI